MIRDERHGSGVTGSTREGRRQEKRERILQAGRESLRANGLANTTISEIIRRSGCSSGTIYGYFRNKEEIVEQIARDVMVSHRDEIRRIARREIVPPPVEMLREVLTVFEHDAERAGLIVQFWGVGGSPQAEAISRHMVMQMREVFAEYLERWEACLAGAGKPTYDFSWKGIALAGLFQGYVVQRSLDRGLSVEQYIGSVNALLGHVQASNETTPEQLAGRSEIVRTK